MNREMNRENLSRMADYIETVLQRNFNMRRFRTGQRTAHECGSVGCVIGHCTILDKRPLPILRSGDIDFDEWSEHFTGLDWFYDKDEWAYLFSSDWETIDNTPTGAAKRIRYLIENGLPRNSYKQILGSAPLSYLKNKTA